MYKIYINENPIILTTLEASKQFKTSKTVLVSKYIAKKRFLFQFIDALEKSQSEKTIVLHHPDLELLVKDFFSIYKNLEAGGGIVFNDSGEVLMIKRGGTWDMAKGHMEKGETPAKTAIREVMEETGLQNVELQEFITTTYHTYNNKKGNRCLKISHWFKMKSNDTDFQPQGEEGIEKVVWMPIAQALQLKPIYKNILNLLELSKA
jgi:8-oxo-dGTP pyrophosphatase MutT (NUDIX family)